MYLAIFTEQAWSIHHTPEEIFSIFTPKKLHLQKPTVKTTSLGLANEYYFLCMTGLATTGRLYTVVKTWMKIETYTNII